MLSDLASCEAAGEGDSGDEAPGTEPAEEAPKELFREQLGVVACQEAGAKEFEFDCVHFYNCAAAGGANGPLKGELLKCPKGSQFDSASKKCSKGTAAGQCKKPALNSLLFTPSPEIANAKEAGAEFLA